jgi:hypothetical protein
MASRRKSLILGILRLVVSLEPVSSGHQGKLYFLENRDFALGDMSRELAQLKEAAPLEWRREGMSVTALVTSLRHLRQTQLELSNARGRVWASQFDLFRLAFGTPRCYCRQLPTQAGFSKHLKMSRS